MICMNHVTLFPALVHNVMFIPVYQNSRVDMSDRREKENKAMQDKIKQDKAAHQI